jgi:hypothetical protein
MDVLARVQADERKAKAQSMALADASKFAQEAQKIGLRAAATQPSMTVLSTSLFSSGDATAAALLPYKLPNDQACRAFVAQAVNLLLLTSSYDPQHPVGVVDLPQADRADVVQLNDLKPMWNTRTLGIEEYQAGMQQLSKREYADQAPPGPEAFANEWFSYAAVAARLGYVPEKSPQNPPEQPQNLPSQNPF